MKYVALLRGINVGGNSKIEMARLRTLFTDLGYTDVSTYINSGNVIFDASDNPQQITNKIEQGIKEVFGLSVPTIVRSKESIEALCQEIPGGWTNDNNQRTDVLFLWQEIDNPSILEYVKHKPDIERVLYLPGALVWNIDRKNVTRGSMIKIIGTDVYKKMTARNINTVRKLHTLVS